MTAKVTFGRHIRITALLFAAATAAAPAAAATEFLRARQQERNAEREKRQQLRREEHAQRLRHHYQEQPAQELPAPRSRDERIRAQLCGFANSAEGFIFFIGQRNIDQQRTLEAAKLVLEASRTALALRKQAALRGHPCTSEEE